MPSHRETQILPYSPRQMFELVADVEKYPQFLPWCRAARVLENEPGSMLAELIIAFKHLSERYTSRVLLQPPAGEHAACAIKVNMTEGPFHHLVNEWDFIPTASGGTQINFFIDFEFRSKFLGALIGGLFNDATEKMMSAFRVRAENLYGKKAAS